MRKLMIYPYDDEFNPVLKHKDLLEGYRISEVVSLKGWGFCGKDAGITNARDKLGFLVTNEFADRLNQCDAVLFCETRIPVDFDKIILPKVDLAAKYGKSILFAAKLEGQDYDEVLRKCNENNVDFKYFHNGGKVWDDGNIGRFEESLLDIFTPVIFVFGTSQRTNKFDIQLSLRKSFMDKGYRVSQIGSRNYCELLGFHSFPSFMSSNRSEDSKILMFNRYVKEIELTEAPDVIIIGIPGGVIPFNTKFTNKFGIFAYEVSQAVTPDASIFSSLYNEYRAEYFSMLSASVKYKLGYDIDCFNLSNNIFDWIDSDYNGKEVYVTVSADIVDEKLKDFDKLDTPVGNVLNDDSAERMAEFLMDKLAGYAETECV